MNKKKEIEIKKVYIYKAMFVIFDFIVAFLLTSLILFLVYTVFAKINKEEVFSHTFDDIVFRNVNENIDLFNGLYYESFFIKETKEKMENYNPNVGVHEITGYSRLDKGVFYHDEKTKFKIRLILKENLFTTLLFSLIIYFVIDFFRKNKFKFT